MTNLDRGAFPFGIAAAHAAALLLFSFPAVSQDSTSSVVAWPVPTDAQCSEKWGDSEADDSCQNESISVEDGLCRVEAECLVPLTSASIDDSGTLQITYDPTEARVLLDEVARLYNCGGLLTVGNC